MAQYLPSVGCLLNMQDWADFLNRFLELSDYPILTNKGTISAEQARLKAETEYKKFRVEQDKNYISDFDQEVKKLVKGNKKRKS